MTRPLPIVRAGAWYHVTNRALKGSALFPTPRRADAFVTSLGEIAEQFAVEIHSYCAMGNHYHLLVRAQEDELLQAITKLEAGLTMEKVRLLRMAMGRHLLQVTRYIHRNPVEAGLVQSPERWPWSSYRGYVDRLEAPGWLRTDAVLGWLGPIGARQRYRRFVEQVGVAS